MTRDWLLTCKDNSKEYWLKNIELPWWLRWLKKKSACNAGDLGSIPELGRSLEQGMATHSSILSWRIPWTEEAGRLQSMGSQRAGQDLVTEQQQVSEDKITEFKLKLYLLSSRYLRLGPGVRMALFKDDSSWGTNERAKPIFLNQCSPSGPQRSSNPHPQFQFSLSWLGQIDSWTL